MVALVKVKARKPDDLKGLRVTVMGLGTKGGGVETVKYLVRHKAKVKVTDIKTAEELEPSLKKIKDLPVELILGAHREEDFVDADLVIPNPDVPLSSKYLAMARSAKVQIETDISLFFKFCPAPIASVTGTRGKSTTVTVAGQILRVKQEDTVIAGNILRSPLADLDNLRSDTPVVLELSSWQLEGLARKKLSPHWALVTSIFPDHLNRYKSMDDYVSAKELIFKYQKENDHLILSADDEIVSSFSEKSIGKLSWFSITKDLSQTKGDYIYVKNNEVTVNVNGKISNVLSWDELGGSGVHTRANMMAGTLLALKMGASLESARIVLKNFKGVPHRLESVKVISGRTFIDDTTATIPEAVVAAINSFPDRRKILITGGTDKKLNFEPLVSKLSDESVAHVIFLHGSATNKILELINREKSKHAKSPVVKTMKEALELAVKTSLPGDVILLSPGAASFELFRDEFDRGEQFKAIVNNLKDTDF